MFPNTLFQMNMCNLYFFIHYILKVSFTQMKFSKGPYMFFRTELVDKRK